MAGTYPSAVSVMLTFTGAARQYANSDAPKNIRPSNSFAAACSPDANVSGRQFGENTPPSHCLRCKTSCSFPLEARQPRVPLHRRAHVHAHLAALCELPLQCWR
eukprot:3946390-Prymnesium_polylepis.1